MVAGTVLAGKPKGGLSIGETFKVVYSGNTVIQEITVQDWYMEEKENQVEGSGGGGRGRR